MLRVQGVHKTFFAGTVNEKVALTGIDLRLKPGDFVTVIGSNGAGKSTLLNIVAGRLKPDVGSVSIAGDDVTRLREHQRARYVGRVFQDPLAGTSPSMTIEENLALAYRRGKRRGLSIGVTGERRRFFREQLAVLDLGLEDRLKMKVGLLSGGQRQALSLLMATFTEPNILLLDEHTAALDPKRVASITKLTEEIVKNAQLTTLMVTHNMEQALQLGNRLIMMHEGRIVLDLSEEKKCKMDVADLLHAFEDVRGEAFAEDRYVLQ
ncbi:ABC transporter ATP-binding protein [Numidum massiliense]|uniref:ABC transporter ATP-binding protein n=1 Tax=Numidum massiliense TaxID=1522315 RepID=UPI0006D574F1|nr:ABC transporter ATP-binding protein [Numidum massiliense]